MHLELGQVPALVVSSPEMAKEVLKVHDTKFCSRPDSYGMRKLSYNQKDVSFSPYGDYWREMCKLCVIELFTVKRVRSFQHVRDREIAKFVNIISQEALDPNNKFIYLDKKIFSLAKNIISEVAFGSSSVGEKFREDELQKIIQDVMKVTSGFCAADFFPYIGWIIDLLSGFRHKMEKCFLDIDKFNEGVIKEHLDPSRPMLKHEDITDILIALSNDETGALRLTKDHIKAVFVDLFMASIDTSSGTIVWAMSELAKNPRLPSGMKPEDANMEEEVGLTINKKYPLQLVPIKHKIETE
ncbi:hypothetical protein POM88_036731 [Heracleum sosnowskyi]|uniref:Cytochrome P450 n=1 Tax=Heracleum sosnowskyi TaxID=360622 RepID=A0AAD8MFA3_9APIA|nr:hypothetical protein POM88_036731 [Heracleum sosnowskyi]